MNLPNRNRTIRNLSIFTLSILALPWLGVFLDLQSGGDPHNQQQSLGWLLFLVTPLFTALLLRTFAGDGWQDFGLKPAFRGNGKWYLFALFFHPITYAISIGIGVLAGGITVPDLSATRLSLVGQAILLGLGPSVIKNIFEEFAWRGYLAPKMYAVVKNTLLGHLLVGLIWFSWHLPYYLFLLNPADLQKFTSLSAPLLIGMGYIATFPLSIIYGELRLRTQSVWPALLIHVSANVVFDALMLQKFFVITNLRNELLFAPGLSSLVGITLLFVAGFWLYFQREKDAAGGRHA